MSLDSTRERCRICLETTESHFSLHKVVPIGEDDVLMSKILIYCGNVEVSHDDRKPQKACFTCMENAKVAYKFKTMCTQSEATLNTEIFNKTISECDPLESKMEDDILEVTDVEIRNIKEEQSNLNNAEVCSEESNDSFNDYENYEREESNDCFEYNDEQEESRDSDVEYVGTTKKNNHNCPDCGKSFVNRSRLTRHCRTHNKKDEKRKCPYCDFKAKGRDVTRHMSDTHDDRKILECHTCNKRFFEKQKLQRHMITHADVKNHVCGVCGKAFKWALSLREHMLSHSGEQLHSCTLCEKKFRTKADQKNHMNIHASWQVFKCDVCSKEFNRRYTLQVHMLTHTGERSHVCEVCKKTFTQAQSLRLHKKLYHPNT